MSGSKHLKISEDLHDTIKFYCWYHGIKIEYFIDKKLREIPEIKEFRNKKKILKN